MEIRRLHYDLIRRRLEEPRRFIQVIAGPRQVGKTTTIRQLLKDSAQPYLSVVADNVAAGDTQWIDQQWEAARLQMNAADLEEYLLVIDEVQKIDRWSEAVKKQWDADTTAARNLKVVLLGSSRLMLQQGLTESLAGRFELIPMMHWSFSEMQEAFDVTEDQYAWFGGYPGAASLVADERRWKDYILNSIIEPSISRDILMLTRVDKPALLRQTFELGCIYSGQQLSYNKMLGQLQDAGNTTTLAHYMKLLDSAGLLSALGKYSNAAVQSRNSSPKLQVYNNALLTAYSPESMHTIRQNPAAWGRWVENIVGTHLLNGSATGNYTMHYWRHVNDEVDFILKQGAKAVAIEVKSGRTTRAGGMTAAARQFSFYKTLLVGTDGLTWKDFIKIKPELLFE
jgi:predicted AAA+ superfamily ATPase